MSKTRIVLVLGPPGSGKAAHIERRRRPGDLVLDVDALTETLTGEGTGESDPEAPLMAAELRQAALRRLLRRPWNEASTVWVPTTAVKPEDLAALLCGHRAERSVLLAPPADFCKARCAQEVEDGERPDFDWDSAVDRWWVNYEASKRLAGQQWLRVRPPSVDAASEMEP